MDRKPPPKRPEVQAEVRRLLDAGHYYEEEHALQRMAERGIFSRQVRYVLRHGRRDASRDTFDKRTDSWRYVIEGQEPDEAMRIRLAFSIM